MDGAERDDELKLNVGSEAWSRAATQSEVVRELLKEKKWKVLWQFLFIDLEDSANTKHVLSLTGGWRFFLQYSLLPLQHTAFYTRASAWRDGWHSYKFLAQRRFYTSPHKTPHLTEFRVTAFGESRRQGRGAIRRMGDLVWSGRFHTESAAPGCNIWLCPFYFSSPTTEKKMLQIDGAVVPSRHQRSKKIRPSFAQGRELFRAADYGRFGWLGLSRS